MLQIKPLIETSRAPVGLGVEPGLGTNGLPPIYTPPVPLTEEASCHWLASALVGQAIQYHEGFLLLDRSESGSALSTKDRHRLHAVARRMWIAAELGLVHLFSVRVADCHYRYIAVRSASTLTPAEIRNRLRPGGVSSAAPIAANH